jgi:hypothetical protein
MIRLVTTGAILLPFLGLLSVTVAASNDFQDIPYLPIRINQVLEREPTGAEVEWRNEATGSGGVIRVLKTYFPSSDAPCRDYERTTRQPDGTEKLVRGTGCRDASGRWSLKEQEESEAAEPEPLRSGAPGQGSQGSSSPAQQGGQAGQTGGQAGGQAGGQTGGQSRSQTQGQTQAGTGGADPSGSAQPAASQGEPAAPEAASESPKPAAPKPSEPATSEPQPSEPQPSEPQPSEPKPSPPEFDLPTPSQ